MDLPIGFRFCPSDRELLSYYLVKRLKGESTQFQIQDVDVYGIEPWSLFNDIHINDSDDDDDDDDEATYSNNLTYVFTTIKKRHGNGSERISRTVTTPSSKNQVIGTWKDQKAHDIIDMVSKKIIGVKRMLSFMPALSKQDHDDEDDEGTSKKRKRKQITTNNNINGQLDGISYIMHEYSMAGSSYVLCRIKRNISKSRKMNNKKMKYSSSCSKNITRKNTCWDYQGAQYDQPLQGSRMPYEDDHQQILLDHNQSSMLQQQQPDQDAEYNYQQIQECMPQMMMNTSVLDHDQSSMLQLQQPDQYAEYNYQQIQECISQIMMNTSVLDHDQSSMWQQQQPYQDAEYDQQQRRTPYDDHHQIMMNSSVLGHDQSSMWQQQQPDQDAEDDQLLQERIPNDDDHQIMVNASVLGHDQSLMWQQHQPDQDAEDDQLLQGRMTYGEMMNAPILVSDENESSVRQQQQPVQSEAGVTGGSPILTDDEDGFAQLLEEDLLLDNGDEDNTTTTYTSTSTSNGGEDKIIGAGHEEIEKEEDLSNQQQQQPPAPTSEREDNLSLLSSIDFQSDDSPDFGNLYFPSLKRFDDPLDRIPLWSY